MLAWAGQLARWMVSVVPGGAVPSGSIITPATRLPTALAGFSAVTAVIVTDRFGTECTGTVSSNVVPSAATRSRDPP